MPFRGPSSFIVDEFVSDGLTGLSNHTVGREGSGVAETTCRFVGFRSDLCRREAQCSGRFLTQKNILLSIFFLWFIFG